MEVDQPVPLIYEAPPQLEDILPIPLALDDVLGSPVGGGDPGKSGTLTSKIESRLAVLGKQFHLQRRSGELDAASAVGEGAIQDPLTWPLELGKTLIVYHPHAQRPPEVVLTRELSGFTRHLDASEDPIDDTRPPYSPFETLADFEQTELFIKRDCADPFVNEQLSLWRQYAPNSDVTLKNAREMHQRLWAAGIEEDLSQVVFRSYAL